MCLMLSMCFNILIDFCHNSFSCLEAPPYEWMKINLILCTHWLCFEPWGMFLSFSESFLLLLLFVLIWLGMFSFIKIRWKLFGNSRWLVLKERSDSVRLMIKLWIYRMRERSHCYIADKRSKRSVVCILTSVRVTKVHGTHQRHKCKDVQLPWYLCSSLATL